MTSQVDVLGSLEVDHVKGEGDEGETLLAPPENVKLSYFVHLIIQFFSTVLQIFLYSCFPTCINMDKRLGCL